MPYKLNLPNVSSKYGAPMGRANELPEDREFSYLLHLTRVRLVDGGYDAGGAYWGVEWIRGDKTIDPLYCAEDDNGEVLLFIRPSMPYYTESNEWREAAKELVRASLPNARFYR